MALNDILAAINAEADAEIERVASETDVRVREIRRRASEEVDAVEAAASSVLDDDAQRRCAQIVNRARLVVERRVAAAAEEVYEEMMEQVGRRLVTVRERADYRDLFRRLFGECRATLPDGRIVLVDPADEVLAHEVTGAIETEDYVVEPSLTSMGGLELVTGDGRRRVRNTLESRTRRADRALRSLATTLVPPLGGA